MENYILTENQKKTNLKNFLPYIKGEVGKMLFVFIIILVNSAANVIAPFLLGLTIDQAITQKDYPGLVNMCLLLLAIYAVGLVTNYLQVKLMGTLSQRVLLRLRQGLFQKIQELPMAFFINNKTGDLISRINSDTDKLNQFFSESLIRFAGNIFTIIGIAVFIFFLNVQLTLIALSMAVVLFIITSLISPWIKKQNSKSLQTLGQLSGDIQENLNNFRVLAAFNQGHYFLEKFSDFNQKNYQAAKKAGISNHILMPLYDFSSNAALALVVLFGIKLIQEGALTIGLLVTYISYTNHFYQPLRILASLWSTIQVSLAAWGRVDQILHLKSNLKVEKQDAKASSNYLLEFKKVDFGYHADHKILKDIDLHFEKGKTYAIIGPTGGGKSTLASLMARLYDPTDGHISLNGKNLKSYSPEELATCIGFILQEPFIFSGTLLENIIYGNKALESYDHKELLQKLKILGLDEILASFKEGLETKISSHEGSLSLGQKQLIAFLRIILRQPELLIMDEATANIDTVTEKNLEKIINNLPPETTKVIIAHRLNTIKKADEIIFISEGKTQRAMSFEKALDLIQGNVLKS